MPRNRREKNRDDRDFDTSCLTGDFHGRAMGRDYTAHWHRWGFARRLIKKTDHVLDVGCGVDRPLWRLLFNLSFPQATTYTGVDINPLKPTEHRQSTLYGDFNFCQDYKKIAKPEGSKGFDIAIHMEVIEHMKVEHGRKLLKGCFELLRPGGLMVCSTPVYDGVRHAANHIHEYTIPELQKAIEKAGFVIEQRFGAFMDVKHVGKPTTHLNILMLSESVRKVAEALGEYYDNEAMSCIFAPLYADLARNNLWVCRKPS